MSSHLLSLSMFFILWMYIHTCITSLVKWNCQKKMNEKERHNAIKLKPLNVLGVLPIRDISYPQFCSYCCSSKAQNSTCDRFSKQWICSQMIIICLENDFERVFKIHHIWMLHVFHYLSRSKLKSNRLKSQKTT